jgi:hypothetical protein
LAKRNLCLPNPPVCDRIQQALPLREKNLANTDYIYPMGMTLGSITACIILLALLFFAGRFLFRINLRNRGKKYFLPLAILSIITYLCMLCISPYAWLLLSILLSGENFNRG